MKSAQSQQRRAVFLDRDGVLIEDRGPLCQADEIVLAPGAAFGVRRLKLAGFTLVVVSNQTVVARGLATEAEAIALQSVVAEHLVAAGGAPLDGFYFCPHHPNATVPEYRQDCRCRKPSPGLLEAASAELGIDLSASVMVGDRPSDVLAGRRAGCRTIQLATGRHRDRPIEVSGGFTPEPPDAVCATLAHAAEQILEWR